jgi:ribosomal protein S14
MHVCKESSIFKLIHIKKFFEPASEQYTLKRQSNECRKRKRLRAFNSILSATTGLNLSEDKFREVASALFLGCRLKTILLRFSDKKKCGLGLCYLVWRFLFVAIIAMAVMQATIVPRAPKADSGTTNKLSGAVFTNQKSLLPAPNEAV